MTDSLSVTSMSEDERDIQPIKRIKKNPKKDEMKVFLRLRPLDSFDLRGPIGVNEEEKCLKGVSHDEYLNQRIDEFRGLRFNKIFKEQCPQEEFYNEVIAPILPDVFHYKKSSLIFAYGVTNSGKTHSIMGSKKYNQNGDGILPRVLHYLVEAKTQIKQQLIQKIDFNDDGIFSSSNRNYEPLLIDGVQIDLSSFINHSHNPSLRLQDINILFENFEIYNEDIFDLQNVSISSQPQPIQFNNTFHTTYSQQSNADYKKEKRSASKHNTSQKNKLKIKEKFNKKVYIKDLVTNEVENSEQISQLIKNAIENRQVRNNNVNQSSSRSQCCFKIRVKFTYAHAFHCLEEEASLLILDLAGAERAKKTHNTGSKMTESCHINKTLLCLGNCIRALRNGDDNMPYRESKLTRVLNEYFVDQNNVLMIVHIHPGISYTEENINVLKYAAIGLEAKLKAAAPVYEGNTKYSFLMDSAQKSRHDKSYISNISYDPRSNYRDYQSMDQDQIFAQIDNLINNGNNGYTNYLQSDQKNKQAGLRGTIHNDYQQFLGNSSDVPNLDQVINYEMSKAIEEKQKQLEDKYRELEIKEVILMQKRAIENFDLQFESMINEEQNKLKLGKSLFNQFKIPDQIMYGDIPEDDINKQHLESLKNSQQDVKNSSQSSQREIIKISSQQFKRNSQKSSGQNEEKINQVGGGNGDLQQAFGKTPLQSQELQRSNKTNNILEVSKSSNNESDGKYYIRDKKSTNSLRLNDEDMHLVNLQDKSILLSQNSLQSQKENIQIQQNMIRNSSNKFKEDDFIFSKHTSLQHGSQNNLQLVQSQKTNLDRKSDNMIYDSQIQSLRKNTNSQNQQEHQEHLQDEQYPHLQNNLSQNTVQNSNLNSSKKMIMDVENENQRKQNVDMIAEGDEYQKNQLILKKNSLLVKGVDIDKYIEDVYESSAKKEQSMIMVDESLQSNNQLLESIHIYEANDSESEQNKTAPNSINSSSIFDQKLKQRNSSFDILSLSQQLIVLKQKQDQERNNLQQSLENGEEQLKQYLELNLDEDNLKQQILSQSQKLMQLIKDKEDEMDLQRKYFSIQQDNKLKEEDRKMKQFQEWISQIQQELKVQQRYLEQKEVILSQQQMELASLQTNLQEKYRIQQEQIQENLLASNSMKEQIQKQEKKLREETERITMLQQKLEEEMHMLIKEKNLLGIQRQKSEKIKSQNPTPIKQQNNLNQNTMDDEQSLKSHQDHHVNFDLSNLPPIKQTMEEESKTHMSTPRKLSGSFYPGHIPIPHTNSMHYHDQGKSFAEKQIQTSALRHTSKTQSQQSQADASTYAYYTYSEAEQVHPSLQTNTSNQSQFQQLSNYNNAKDNLMNISIKNKNKNPVSIQIQKNGVKANSPKGANPTQQITSSLKLCQQINLQNNNQNLTQNHQLKEELKQSNLKQEEKNSQNSQTNSGKQQYDMIDEKEQQILPQSDNEEEQNGDNQQEIKRKRGRKNNGKKQKKATSKERKENTSIDSSTSKDSENESENEELNKRELKEQSNQIHFQIDNISEKENTRKGRSRRQKRESVSSDKSRNSNSSVDSQKSSRSTSRQNKNKKKPTKKQLQQMEKSNEIVEEQQNKNKRSNSNSTNNGKKKNKNRK